MELVNILLLYIGTVAFLVWVCVLSDPNSDSLGGKLNILLTEDAPAKITGKLRRWLPAKAYDNMAKTYDYVVNQRNPLLQLLYLALFLGSVGVYLLNAWGRLTTLDVALSIALTIACQISFYISCSVRAGTITPQTWRRFDHYPDDGMLYEPGRVCETCKVPKLARSKHCRLCGGCQARFDHHCGWLNQCVGEENYRHFLFFLFLHSVTFFYGSSRMFKVLWGEVRDKKLLEATFYSPASQRTVAASPMVVLQYLVVHDGSLCGVMALCSVMALVITGFLLYHLRLVVMNVTTNETFKWAVVKMQAKHAREAAMRVNQISGGAIPLPARVPAPPNTYHLSFINNIREVIWPRSLKRPPSARVLPPVVPPAGGGSGEDDGGGQQQQRKKDD